MDLDRDFETFMGGPTLPTQKRFHVTFSPTGVIYLNVNAFKALGSPGAVSLHYSRTQDVIAAKPASPRLNISFPVLNHRAGHHIYAAPFARHFKLHFKEMQQFIDPDINPERMLLRLGQTFSIARKPLKSRQ